VDTLLPLLVVIPIGAAFLVPVVAAFRPARTCAFIAVVCTAAILALSIATFFADESRALVWLGGYDGGATGQSAVGIAMVCDGLTRLMLLIVNTVCLLAMVFSVSYMTRYAKPTLYYSLSLLMIGGMNGVVLSGDIFNIYVFLEVAAVASYALVDFGSGSHGSEELEASFKYLVLSAVASAFILLGIGIVYNVSGTLNLAAISTVLHSGGMTRPLWLALGLFLSGFGLKAAMVPFHAWLPDAHPSAPAPVSAMLSGVLIKATGVYVIARFVFNVFGPSAAVGTVLMTLGAASMLVGVLLAVHQWDFKRLLAYHSISQMGYVMLALGVGAWATANDMPAVAGLAVFGAIYHMMNHAIFKSLLFLCAGSVVFGTGTRDLHDLGGMRRMMPVTSACTRVAALSISGVPPFNGFFSKLLITIAVVWSGHYLLGGLTVLVSFLTLLSFTKVQRYLIEGDTPAELEDTKESPTLMLVSMAVLAGLCLAAGLLLPLYMDSILQPAADALTNGPGTTTALVGG
jgi:multicomponent Na+:H+ antiporter subunit D